LFAEYSWQFWLRHVPGRVMRRLDQAGGGRELPRSAGGLDGQALGDRDRDTLAVQHHRCLRCHAALHQLPNSSPRTWACVRALPASIGQAR